MRMKWVLVAVLVAMALPAGLGHAGEAEDRALAWRRRSALRERAERYLRAWTAPVVQRDPKCSGEGVRRYLVRDNRGRVVGERSEPCPTCSGSGKLIRWTTIETRLAYYTPEFRANSELVAELKAQAERWFSGAEVEPRIDRIRVEDATLVGDRNGTVTYSENGTGAAKELRWVELPAGGGREATWCLYTEGVDGAWGFAKDRAPNPLPAPAIPAPLEDKRVLDLAQRAAVAGVKHTVTAARVEEGVLVVSLFLPSAADARALAGAARVDIIPATRVAMRSEPAPESVRLEFLGRWRDKFGAVTRRPTETAWIARATFEKIVFENLSPAELLALWTVGSKTYEGEVPWWKD